MSFHHRMRHHCIAAAALGLAGTAWAQTIPFDIAAQPLDAALTQLARQAGLQLLAPPELVQGRTANAVRGPLAAPDAARQLLQGSGLAARVEGATLVVEPAPANATLGEVTVKADAERSGSLPAPYAGAQVARGARLGFLGNTDVMDTPLSMVSFTAQTVADQQARTLGEVVANDASVRLTGQSNGVTDSYAIRGFPVNDGNIGDVSFDGLYGVAPNYQTSAAYAERIELVKGPTALLNGIAPNGALGGSLNIVPKRADALPLTRVTLDYASRRQAGMHVDLGRRFGDNQEWGLRVNGVYRDGATERDKQSAETRLGALALDYRGSRLRASVDYVDQRLTVDAPTRQPMLASGVQVPDAINARRNLAQSWDTSILRDRSLLARIEYDLSERLSAYLAAGASRSAADGLYGNPVITSTAGDVSVTPTHLSFHLRKWSAEAGLRGRLRTGSVAHRWTLGVNNYHDEMDVGFAFATAALTSNIYRPTDEPVVELARPNETAYTRSTLRGLALADTMAFADDRVQFTLGVRRQQVHTASPAAGTRYDAHALTPMVGLVFKVRPDLSLFANYIQGLNVGDTAPTSALNVGEVFAPYKAKQYEAGVKYDGGQWLATASVFQITKPSGQLNADGYYRPDAQQRNRGLEISITGEPVRGLRPLAGLTWMDGQLTRASAAVQGNDAPGVPSFQANLGLEWDIPGVPGAALTGRTLYTASQYVDQANTQQLPAWWRIDVGARYATRIANRAVVWRINVLNAFDRRYWAGVTSWGGLAIGESRTVRVSMQVDF